MGVVGLEIAFPLLYTYLVKTGELTLRRLVECLCYAPRKRFGLTDPMVEGQPASFTLFDLDESYTIDPQTFVSMGHSTPFAGWKVQGRCLLTVSDGRIAYRDPSWEV